MTDRHPVIAPSCHSHPIRPFRATFPSRGRLAIRGSHPFIRPSGIAPFRHPERSELSFVRKAVPRKQGTVPKDRGEAATTNLKSGRCLLLDVWKKHFKV